MIDIFSDIRFFIIFVVHKTLIKSTCFLIFTPTLAKKTLKWSSVTVYSASSCQFAFCVDNNKRAILTRFTNIFIFSLQPELEGRFCSLHIAWNKSHSSMLQLSLKCYSIFKNFQIEEYVQKRYE